MNRASADNYLDDKMRETFGEYYSTFSIVKSMKNIDKVQARMPFTVSRF